MHRVPRLGPTAPTTKPTSPSERLETYRTKRDFKITSEPSGTAPPPPDGNRFVVQRHRARALHYDLRLEMAGVLASWAVPKGPTLDASAKRMAVHVEDHPLDYYDFEGVIPAGEYGGGDVVVWDWGTWAPVEDDPVAAIEGGNLHFDLDGEKLHGRFVLVRKDRDRRAREQWLLLKKRDDEAVAGWDPEEHPRSVKSGRTNDEVLASPAATWSSDALWVVPTADQLAALDTLGRSGTWRVGDHEVRLGDLDEVRLPGRRRGRPVTTRDLVRHVTSSAPVVLAYLHDHPVELDDSPGRRPAWLRRVDGQIVADSPAALAWCVGRGAIELRIATGGSWAVVAIEGRRFDDVVVAARLHRAALEHLDLDGRPVLDGRRGVQVWIPAAGGAEHVGRWATTLAEAITATVPDLGVVQRVPTDVVVPFSPVDAPGAPVVVPLTWDELDDTDLRPDRWTVRDVGERIVRVGDPLAPLIGRPQRLPDLRREAEPLSPTPPASRPGRH